MPMYDTVRLFLSSALIRFEEETHAEYTKLVSSEYIM